MKGNLVAVKKQASDGALRTYWVDPNRNVSLKQPRVQDLPGQAALFDGDTDGRGGQEYLRKLSEQTEQHLIRPLIEQLKGLDPELGNRLGYKYDQYPFDQESKELDLHIDYATAWYLQKIKRDREHADEWREEYNQKTERPVKALNKRKRSVLALNTGDQVVVRGIRTKIDGWSKRGFPIVNGQAVFFEELGLTEEKVA